MIEERIPIDEISFHPNSFGDLDGRLFFWNGQLYRGINAEWAPFLRRLFQDGVIKKLVNRGLLIDTELTPMAVEGYEIVVRHRPIPFPSYTHEWCAAMLKDAALTILEISIELAQYLLALKDSHPWNVLFDAYRPVYVDLTSIAPLSHFSRDGWWEGFCKYAWHPLLLMAQGQERIARWLLWDYDGIRKSDFLFLTGSNAKSASNRQSIFTYLEGVWQRIPQSYQRLLKSRLSLSQSLIAQQISHPKSHLDFLKRIRREVDGLRIPFDDVRQPHPSIHYQQSHPIPGVAKYDALRQILSDKRPQTVLDVGSHTGWLSKLAAQTGARVVSFDNDSRDVELLYADSRKENLSILPLVMDFSRPTPARGLSDHCYIAATERFQCEMVFALSLVEDLVIKRHLNFEQIVDGLSQFSKRWVVVEFIPHVDQEMPGGWLDKAPWYTLDQFACSLRRRFRDVSLIPASSESSVLFLCEK